MINTFYKMNWKQIHTALTKYEHNELGMLMFQYIKTHAQPFIIARGRLIYEQCSPQLHAHYHNGRRRKAAPRYLLPFVYILSIVTIATIVLASQIPPVYGAPLVFLYVGGMIMILLFKPSKRILRALAN